MKYEIRNRFTNTIQFTAEINCDNSAFDSVKLSLAVRAAILRGADLRGAYMRGADLRGAYMRGADLRGAYMRGAGLRGANLRGADLHGADLRGADLHGADLRGADLRGADLRGANLRGADLHGANLGDQWVIHGATRSDGYEFLLTSFDGEGTRVKAGCRDFMMTEARAHWAATRGGTPLGDETFAILDNLEALARIRGYKV